MYVCIYICTCICCWLKPGASISTTTPRSAGSAVSGMMGCPEALMLFFPWYQITWNMDLINKPSAQGCMEEKFHAS